MRIVAEISKFSRQADKAFNEPERRELIKLLATRPLTGDKIPRTGSVRKLRFAVSGRGKRGGARVICFYVGEQMRSLRSVCLREGEKDRHDTGGTECDWQARNRTAGRLGSSEDDRDATDVACSDPGTGS